MQINTVKIDPQKAMQLLEGNVGNRPPRKTYIQHLARQMMLGRWKLSPQPIVVTKSGRVIDGQHRLEGICLSGERIETCLAVIDDKDAEAVFMVMDQGLARNVSDVLRTSKTIVNPISFLLRAGLGLKKATPEDVQELLDSEVGGVLRRVDEEVKPKGKTWKHTAFRAAFAIAVLAKDKKTGKPCLDEEQGFEAYKVLSEKPINQWPDIFASMYRQVNEFDRPLKSSGRSLENDWFSRGLFAFRAIGGNANTKTIRITPGFIQVAKEMTESVLMQNSKGERK